MAREKKSVSKWKEKKKRKSFLIVDCLITVMVKLVNLIGLVIGVGIKLRASLGGFIKIKLTEMDTINIEGTSPWGGVQ